MLEGLSPTSVEAVRKALEHLGELLEPYQLARLKLSSMTIPCIDAKDASIQYVVLLGPPNYYYLVEVTTGRLVDGYSGFHLHIDRKGNEPGVPRITIDYIEKGGEHVGT